MNAPATCTAQEDDQRRHDDAKMAAGLRRGARRLRKGGHAVAPSGAEHGRFVSEEGRGGGRTARRVHQRPRVLGRDAPLRPERSRLRPVLGRRRLRDRTLRRDRTHVHGLQRQLGLPSGCARVRSRRPYLRPMREQFGVSGGPGVRLRIASLRAGVQHEQRLRGKRPRDMRNGLARVRRMRDRLRLHRARPAPAVRPPQRELRLVPIGRGLQRGPVSKARTPLRRMSDWFRLRGGHVQSVSLRTLIARRRRACSTRASPAAARTHDAIGVLRSDPHRNSGPSFPLLRSVYEAARDQKSE